MRILAGVVVWGWFELLTTVLAHASPQVDLVGNVFCRDETSYLPASGVVVELPDIGARTRSRHGNGYYRVRGPFGRMYDHNVTLVLKLGSRVVWRDTVFLARER